MDNSGDNWPLVRQGPEITRNRQIGYFSYRPATGLIKQALDRFEADMLVIMDDIQQEFDLTPPNVNKSGVESRFISIKVEETA